MVVQRQVPIAEQITSVLHQRVLEGIYAPGARLPSESELADEMGVSRGTIRSALASLATTGLIDRKQGDGTYVRLAKDSGNSLMYAVWEFAHLIEASGQQSSIGVISIDKRSATETEAGSLGIGLDEDVVVIERLFYADDQPLIYSTNLSPVAIFSEEMGQLDATLGLHGFLKKYCSDLEIARVDMDISAVIANQQVQAALSLAPNTPILKIEQVFRDINRRPLVMAINHHRGDKLSLHDVRPWYSWGRQC